MQVQCARHRLIRSTHVSFHPGDDDAESLIQAHHGIRLRNLPQQLHNLLDRRRQVRQERRLVKVPRVAPSETPSCREADRLIRRRVPADEVDEQGVDLIS